MAIDTTAADRKAAAYLKSQKSKRIRLSLTNPTEKVRQRISDDLISYLEQKSLLATGGFSFPTEGVEEGLSGMLDEQERARGQEAKAAALEKNTAGTYTERKTVYVMIVRAILLSS